ncbi:taste receptor type 2 member 20-like [Tenrec ecaudatus]|uniref:taste receptor type 2 member 20-like n=1 Tax=Tenrec ecaudatus TaxID=94439 RepID=UPI003F5925D6
MIRSLQNIFAAILIVEFIFGHVANGFIALVNCIDWVKRQKISLADAILTALAVSRIGLLWVILINWYSTISNPFTHRLDVRVMIAWIVTNHFSMWLAACLSIFYLLKIANFSNLLFLYLKYRAERLVLMIMLGTLIILGFQFAVLRGEENIQRNDCEGNMTLKTNPCDTECFSQLAVFTLTIFLPFVTSLISLLLLIFSLGKHLKKMQRNGKELQDPSTKAHVKAMLTVIFFLLLFVIYFSSLMLSGWNSEAQKRKQPVILWQAIGIIYPSGHSFILILVNQKLKQAFLSVLGQLNGWLQEGKS